MIPENRFTDEEIKKRFETHFVDGREFTEGQILYLGEKLSSLSEFIREIKVGFARYYNRRHDRFLKSYFCRIVSCYSIDLLRNSFGDKQFIT